MGSFYYSVILFPLTGCLVVQVGGSIGVRFRSTDRQRRYKFHLQQSGMGDMGRSCVQKGHLVGNFNSLLSKKKRSPLGMGNFHITAMDILNLSVAHGLRLSEVYASVPVSFPFGPYYGSFRG